MPRAVLLAIAILLCRTAQAAQCDVTYDQNTNLFYNACPYKVLISYSAQCPGHTYTNMTKVPVDSFAFSSQTVGGSNCVINYSWQRF